MMIIRPFSLRQRKDETGWKAYDGVNQRHFIFILP